MLELEKAGDAYADLTGAHQQLCTYVEELPMAFRGNVVCVVSDGVTARYGTAFTPSSTSRRRAIEGTMRRLTRHNVVRQEAFSTQLVELMRRYTNQNLTSAEIIAELAFYDAVASNESAVTEMGEGQLADIARDLVRAVRRSVTVDWMSRDDVRAKLRSTIKRLLAVHGYPPDAAPAAIAWCCARWRRSRRSGHLVRWTR